MALFLDCWPFYWAMRRLCPFSDFLVLCPGLPVLRVPVFVGVAVNISVGTCCAALAYVMGAALVAMFSFYLVCLVMKGLK